MENQYVAVENLPADIDNQAMCDARNPTDDIDNQALAAEIKPNDIENQPTTTAIKAEDEEMEEDDDDEEDEEGMETDENEDVTAAVLVAAAEAAEMGNNGIEDGTPEEIAAAVAAAAEADATGPPSKRRRTGKKGARPWNDMLYELLKYRFLHGNVMVPFKSGGDLGKWVAVQRAQYVSLQKAVQVKQEIEAATAIQENSTEAIQENAIEAGNEIKVGEESKLGDESKAGDESKIGGENKVVDESKKYVAAHSEGSGSERLTDERMKILSSIGFVWDVVQADNDARWKRRFEELKEYKAIHGHCNVPQSTDLGKWVKMQRENKHEADLKLSGSTPARKKPKPCLSGDRIEKLESIGFQWRVAKPAVGWDNRYEQLVQYRNQHGDCNVPQSYPPDKPFGRWVMKQRCQHSLKLRGEKSQLTDEREKKLNDIGFSWVAPGFSKKTVTMPGDEEEAEAVQQQAVAHMAAQQLHQEALAAAAAAEAADLVHADDYKEFSTWNV